MSRTLPVLLVALTVAAPAAAQDAADAVMTQTRANYERVASFITLSAEQLPEEHYSFRPTADVRTFGEILGHIANSQFFYCSSVLGESNPNEENFEERTTKAGLVEAVKMSFKHCERAYALGDGEAAMSKEMNGRTMVPFARILGNATHMWEHYGNLVTYLRMKGLVPPSSQRRM